MEKPNIFENATSELSQDAVLIWLANWAKNKYYSTNEKLNKTGNYFLKSLIKKANYDFEDFEDFEEIKIIPQFNKIDVFIELKKGDKKIAIIIEDKVKSSEHSNQLEKYYNKILARGFQKNQIIPIYLKTGFQHDLENVLNKGYYFYSVHDLIEVFNFGNSLGIKNEIFTDYFEHLKGLLDEFENNKSSYENFGEKKIKDWNWWNWIGFFEKYHKTLKANWGIVPNGREKLVAFWFGGTEERILDNDKEIVFHSYIDVKYSGNKYYTFSYRLGLNGNPQKDKRLRDEVIKNISGQIQKEGFEFKVPKFRKAKKTLELLRIENIDKELEEMKIVELLQKMERAIK